METWTPMNIWYQRWRIAIDLAKRNPDEKVYYSRAAAIAQMNYLIYAAMEKSEAKS